MSKNIEIWKPVVGYEGLYEVSSYGRVRSLDRATSYISRTQEGKEYTTTHTFKGKNLSLNVFSFYSHLGHGYRNEKTTNCQENQMEKRFVGNQYWRRQ